MNAAICVLLFLNGVFALAFELVWCKRLEQLLGVGLFAVTVTVSCFLFGLALGGWLGAKLCNSNIFQRKPARLLIWLQAATVAACLLFSIFIFSPLPCMLIGNLGTLAAASLLVVPALGLGILLPAIITVAESEQQSAILYSCNLFGSFAGAALTVFWFMPTAGLWHSAMIATTIGLFALCVLLKISSSRVVVASSIVTPSATTPAPFKYGPFLVGISGFIGIALELIYVRIAGMLFGSGVYSLALVLICYLMSSALGAWVVARKQFNSFTNPVILIFGPLVAAVLLYKNLFFLNKSPWCYLLIYKAIYAHVGSEFAAQVLTSTALLFVLEFVPIFILGAFFVTVLKATQNTRNLGYLICANNLGSIAGAWITGFLLIPSLSTNDGSGIQKTIVVLAVVLCELTIFGLIYINKIMHRTVAVSLAVSLVILLLVIPTYALPPWNAALLSLNVPRLCQISRLVNKLTSYSELKRLAHENQLDFYREGLNSTVSVFSNAQNNVRYLKINGLNEGTIPIDLKQPTGVPTDLSTHQLLAQLPLLVAPKRSLNVCLIGYGTGTTANSILLNSSVQRLQVIELEKCVLEAAKLFNPSIKSNAATVCLEDARLYLLQSKCKSNDVIICQPSEPWVGGASNLFTKQYWQICRHKLAADGVLCQWVQLYGISPQLLADLCRSFISVFPNTIVLHEPGAGEIFLLASNAPLSQDTDIGKIFLERDSTKRSLLMLTPTQLQQWCRDIAYESHDHRIVTDDNLLIEYAMPHIEKDPEACITANLASLNRNSNTAHNK